jgi:hypothetical protein
MTQQTEQEMDKDIATQQASAQKGVEMDVKQLENSKRVEIAINSMKERTKKVE